MSLKKVYNKPTFRQITRHRLSHLLSQEQNSYVNHIYFDFSEKVLSSLQWSSIEIFTLAKPVENYRPERNPWFSITFSASSIFYAKSNTDCFTRAESAYNTWKYMWILTKYFQCLLFIFHFRRSSVAVDQTMQHFQVYKHRFLCSRSASSFDSEHSVFRFRSVLSLACNNEFSLLCLSLVTVPRQKSLFVQNKIVNRPLVKWTRSLLDLKCLFLCGPSPLPPQKIQQQH